ncbi:hypothetical protein [Aquimarina sp. 2201CG5-10]|uniref:hypothetical protein n=1 Tax=Aquimarina callyspongiae TaxID=3098150 RepID=UPI002AB3293E|nr:hypothetical protein [Aquimarina sp. 2201CG5-10]MDY8134269.1 hypothetical protein [Aquimarina sp. 2201CG5-10]
MKTKRIVIIVFMVGLLLLILLIAMQYTDEVDWDLFDFAIAGLLLLGAGLAGNFVIEKIRNKGFRIFVLIVILILLLLVWAELAVGVFETPLSGN